MEIKVEPMGAEVVRIILSGRFDSAGVVQIDPRFKEVTEAYRSVIVDLEAVSFLSSVGMRTLLLGAKTVHRKGGSLVLLKPQPFVKEVLDIGGLLTLLSVVATEDEAAALVGA